MVRMGPNFLFIDAENIMNLPQGTSWGKLMFALLYGAVVDIVAYCEYEEESKVVASYRHFPYMERRKKLKEYWKTRRRAEQACGWISDYQGKRGRKIPYISFEETCGDLHIQPTKVRENIRILVKQLIREKKDNNNYEPTNVNGI